MQEAAAPHGGRMIVIDDSEDRKDGRPPHIWDGMGKTDSGIVTVTTMWTDWRVYYPLHAQPCTPAHFARGRADPDFRIKPQLAAALRYGTRSRASSAERWWSTAP